MAEKAITMQAAVETYNYRSSILMMVAAFLIAAAFGTGIVTMAAFDHRPPTPVAPAVQAPVAARPA